MADAVVRRVVRKSAHAPKRIEPLDEGDLVEYSTTVEVKNRRGVAMWIKGGASSTVRAGETGEQARTRVVDFVTEGVTAQVEQALS